MNNTIGAVALGCFYIIIHLFDSGFSFPACSTPQFVLIMLNCIIIIVRGQARHLGSWLAESPFLTLGEV